MMKNPRKTLIAYEEILRGEERVGEMELVGGRGEEEAAHVDCDGEEVGAVPASHGHGLEEAGAGHAHLDKKIRKI